MFNPIIARLFLSIVSIFAWVAHAAHAAPTTLLVYGDSLSAGYGIALKESWPTLLQQRLAAQRRNIVVANASISGETSAGGRARFAAALQQSQPSLLILALGANDGLRGLPTAALRDNLQVMIRSAKQRSIRVLLVGMRLPPNYGPDYTQAFSAVFSDLARQEKVPLLPFLLEPIAGDSNAFQSDGLHPTAAVQGKILDHIWGTLQTLLR
ncbi:MAG TPA: arylesterase [Rhodocyclaceae bacterium]|nr:arylesterase [Rhodocyclaceae bacterium]